MVYLYIVWYIAGTTPVRENGSSNSDYEKNSITLHPVCMLGFTKHSLFTRWTSIIFWNTFINFGR